MFANLASFWRGKAFMTTVLEEFRGMLEQAEHMYVFVRRRLLENLGEPGLKDKIYEKDRSINRRQKDIRRRIVEHLSIQPTVDVNACLVLMSVIKDAERLGDYAKNLFEVTELLEQPIDRSVFSRYFGEIDADILTLFGHTREAFVESDQSKAEMAWGYENRIAKWCDNTVAELATSDLSVNQAVCLVLVARYFKRLVAHLVNIATAVVLPLSDLDYFDEKRAVEENP